MSVTTINQTTEGGTKFLHLKFTASADTQYIDVADLPVSKILAASNAGDTQANLPLASFVFMTGDRIYFYKPDGTVYTIPSGNDVVLSVIGKV